METILLVDDEPAVLKLCQQILEFDGYSVLPATSGEEALHLLEQNKGRDQSGFAGRGDARHERG